MTEPVSTEPVLGVILAGGLARRMGGGDKALRMIDGRTVLERLIDRMRPQVARLVLNANDDAARFAPYGLKVIADTLPGRQGPLAGVLAALDWAAAEAPEMRWLVTIPGDAPFLPADLVGRLHSARRQAGARLACAVSNGRTHPVIGLWPVDLRDDLRQAVVQQGVRKIDAFTGSYDVAQAEWPAEPLDPFFNVNTPEDLAEADRLATLAPDQIRLA